MEHLARERSFPIVGPHVGQTLQILARGIGARRLLELGSGFGYSAFWFARALQATASDDGELHCTDLLPDNRDRALDFLRRAGLDRHVTFHLGDAREVMQQLSGSFDIIFNDVDKEQYPSLVQPVVERLRVGGLFITDNVLWKGRVTADASLLDETTRAVRRFNTLIHEHPRLATTILPIRDGVALSIRI